MLKRISERILYSPPNEEVDQPCLYAIVGTERTLMVDGGVTPRRAMDFQAELKEATGRGVDYAVVTHWHWDHTFGLIGVDAPVIAHRNTAAHLGRMAGYASWSDAALEERVRDGSENPFCAMNICKVYPGEARNHIFIRQPDIVFDGAMALHLGGLTCELRLLPHVHTDDSVSILVSGEGVLLIGDADCQESYAHPSYYSAPAVLELMAFIRTSGAETIAESHEEPVSLDGFMACNGILEEAAEGVLSGCGDAASLMAYLERHMENGLPEDAAKLAELFANGGTRPDSYMC